MDEENRLKAIILAAGKGTRMKSCMPKVLHDILGKKLVQRVIDNTLKVSGMDEIFVITGHQAENVNSFVTANYPESLTKCILQEPQLGTGDAVFKAYDALKDFQGTVFVLCGDTPLLTTETLQKFYDYHKETKAVLTVMSSIIDNPKGYGRIIRQEDNSLSKIVEEKDATSEEKAVKEINAGVYCLEWHKVSDVFFELTTNNEQGEYYLTDIVDWAVKKGMKSQAFILEDKEEILGINSRRHLAEATAILNRKTLEKLMDDGVTIINPENTFISPETQIGQDSVVYPGCVIFGENQFGENCVIGPNTFIEGNINAKDNVKIIQSNLSNVVIGENSSIGPFSRLRDGVEIASNVRVGNFVEIKKSSIDENTNAAHLSYIGDSELGKNVNIGAGTITANYNPLTKQKSKTILEDDVKIGSNSVLVAPVKVARKANVGAGSIITKDVPEGALALTRGPLKILEGWVDKILNNLKNNK